MGEICMVRLVLDSNCDLSVDFCKAHEIEMIPLSVAFGKELYYENINLSKSEFYEKMENSLELPKTSQPSPQQYLEVFERLAKEGHQIIVLTVTAALSGCYQSAMLAKQMCEKASIEIIDTKNAAIGVQIQALEILKMIQAGLCFDKIVAAAKENVSKTRLIAGIDTLRNLIKGGRVSKATGLIGTLADIKPLVTFDQEGKIITLAKSRGIKRAIKSMIEHVSNEKVDHSKSKVCGFTSNPENMNKMIHGFKECGIEFDHQVEVGAVIGTHAGPNAAAVAYFVED